MSMVVPMVIKQDGRGERSFDIYSRLLHERVVFLGQAVDSDVANLVIAQLLHLEAEDPEADVCLYVNSPGGEVYAGMAIYDTLQFIKPDVQTVCCGIAMSIAAVIQAGGTKGKRTILPHSRMLIHQPHGGFQGQSTDIGIHAAEALALRDLIEERLAQDTGRTKEQVHADSERDRFFTPEEAVNYGLVDRVVADRGVSGGGT